VIVVTRVCQVNEENKEPGVSEVLVVAEVNKGLAAPRVTLDNLVHPVPLANKGLRAQKVQEDSQVHLVRLVLMERTASLVLLVNEEHLEKLVPKAQWVLRE